MTIKEFAHSILRYYVRCFPITKGKQRVVSLLWRAVASGQYKRQTELRQANVYMNCDLRKAIQRQLYYFGSYEKAQCDLWIKLAGQARIVCDIGANVGVYSLLAAATNPKAAVHAFEPTPEMFAAFKNNIELNGISNISVNQIGVGDSSGYGFLHPCTGSDGSNEGMNYITGESIQDDDLSVKMVSIDDYCNQHRIEYIDLMKIDIEGGEYAALLGCEELLRARAIGYIFIEFAEWAANRSGHSTVDIEHMLSDSGYNLFYLHSGKWNPLPKASLYNGINVLAVPHHDLLSF